MRPVVGIVILEWLLLGNWCPSASADGGSLRLSAKKGGYQISVFSAPTPFRAGPVDISVLVQDSLTGEPIPGARVTIRVTKDDQPAWEYRATKEAATNKLFRAVQFVLPEPGNWDMQVKIEGPHGLAVIDGAVEAAEPMPRWQEMWLWIGWPGLAFSLFGVHQVLEGRKSRAAVPPDGRRPVSAAHGEKRLARLRARPNGPVSD
jgi:hypothetical protein